jgi:hypothetical protein
MESGVPKGNVYKRICGHNQDQELGAACNMVVDETSSRGVVHAGIDFDIYFPQKEALEDIEADEEVIDEDDA